jgi:glycosyltransferase involved in cell wall biosynthesis
MVHTEASIRTKTLRFTNKGHAKATVPLADDPLENHGISEISIIIPAFNEELAVRETVNELRKLLEVTEFQAEIIVVDDGSTDRTAREAKAAGARVIQHRSNRGYGASLKTGIIAASNDIIAITDADGTYPAKFLPQMVREIEHADMVVGSRTGSDVNIPISRMPAKWFLRIMANYVANSRIPDLNSGLRVFRRDVAMQYFAILSDQFSFTTTITLALMCDKYAVTYIPIDYRKRQGKSKIVPWDAGSFAILIFRVAMLFRPLRVFIPLAILCIAYGITKASVDMFRDPNISASAILAFVSSLILVFTGMLGDAVATRLGRFNQYAVAGVRPKEYVEINDEPNQMEAVALKHV